MDMKKAPCQCQTGSIDSSRESCLERCVKSFLRLSIIFDHLTVLCRVHGGASWKKGRDSTLRELCAQLTSSVD